VPTEIETVTGDGSGPKLMTIGDVLRRIKKSRSVVEWWLRHPEDARIPFPRPVLVIGRNRYWSSVDIRHWLARYKKYRKTIGQQAAKRLVDHAVVVK
jgi:predicted DNA-binding transcriptional regulator AlpA